MILNIAPSALCLILCLSLSSSTLKCQQPQQQHANHHPQHQQHHHHHHHQYLKQQTNDDHLALLIRVAQHQQQQQGHNWANGELNVTQLLFTRFYHLFKDAPDSVKQQYLSQDQAPVAASNETSRRQQDGFELESGNGPMFLETRRITAGTTDDELAKGEENARRHYFRIINRVFSRVELPDVFRAAKGRASGGHCGQHIGCVEEIPNFPSLLKKSNVSSSFTIYTRDTAKSGHKILYEPTMHHQLQDAAISEIELHEKLKSSLQVAAAASVSTTANGVDPAASATATANAAATIGSAALASSSLSSQSPSPSQPLGVSPIRLVSLAAAATNPLNPLHHLGHHHLGHHRRHNPLARHHLNQAGRRHHQLPIQGNGGRSGDRASGVSASSWQAAAKIVHSQEYPFDLAALEASGFNASLNTRIIVGGYFAKEDEEWIDEVVRQWLLLEPQSNIIKVSWADANRGLYHTAAYNSRIVARQLSLFLHYLDQMFSIDLDKFHLVGHSLGAHIAGFVGADFEGRLARITGLDPAGPIFVELNASMRLDPGDAQFVDVVHTNGGTITKGALGLSTPSGHVDYYCNGGSIQPGCYFSSVTRSIMDPVERVACSHRRSYRYFIEIIKLAISEQQQLQFDGEQQLVVVDRRSDDLSNLTNLTMATANSRSQLPRAFLFEAKNDELVRLTQPEIVLMSSSISRRELGGTTDLAPLKRRLEFHLLKPEFPHGKRGLYFFKTRSEAPFFATKQYALVIKTDVVVKRKIALMAKIDQTLVVEAELDEIPGVYMLAFAPNDPRILELGERVPQLSLMWKHRSFNLLLSQQNELHLSSLELSLLDSDSEEPAVIRYTTATSQRPLTLSVTSSPAAPPSSSSTTTTPTPGQDLNLARNQWYKFEGKLERP